MQKNYLLLSNNKSSGPYSLEQLLQFSLKPTDLIWIVDESVIWQNASEINELAALASKPQNNGLNTLPIFDAAATIQTMVSNSTEVKKPKRTSIYVSLPAGAFTTIQEEGSSLEDKAAALKQKILNFAAQKTEEGKTDNKNTSQAFKGSYPLSIQAKNKKAVWLRTPFLSAAIILIILFGSYFLYRRQPQKIASSQPVILFRTTSHTAEPELKKQDVELKATKTAFVKPSAPAVIEKASTNTTQQKQIAVKTGADSLAASKIAVIKKDGFILEPGKTTPPVAVNQTIPPIEKTPVTNLFQTTSEYFKNEQGISLAVTFRNKSEQSIRTAIVDVFYFDMAKNQIAKETLYFGKMLPGTALTKKSTPKESASATYRVDLVSSEKNGLYVYK